MLERPFRLGRKTSQCPLKKEQSVQDDIYPSFNFTEIRTNTQ
jgi:hypothetical protein